MIRQLKVEGYSYNTVDPDARNEANPGNAYQVCSWKPSSSAPLDGRRRWHCCCPRTPSPSMGIRSWPRKCLSSRAKLPAAVAVSPSMASAEVEAFGRAGDRAAAAMAMGASEVNSETVDDVLFALEAAWGSAEQLLERARLTRSTQEDDVDPTKTLEVSMELSFELLSSGKKPFGRRERS